MRILLRMKMAKSTFLYIALVVALLGVLVFARYSATREPEKEVLTVYDTFAQCIADAGAKFYGTFWCSHCKAQKALFKQSKKLPYIECSTPNGQAQTQECTEKGIKGYPTWIFADGTELSGEQSFEKLSEKTGCAVPQETQME